MTMGGGDLKVDRGERRCFRQERAVRVDRFLPPLLIEQRIRSGQLRLEIATREVAQGPGVFIARPAKCNHDGLILPADGAHDHLARLGEIAGRLDLELPRAGPQPDDGEPTVVVGRRRRGARPGFGGDERTAEGLTVHVPHDATHTGDLGGGAARREQHDQHGQRGSRAMRTLKHI
jgi:hypothetical protein